MIFENRQDAGQKLAISLSKYKEKKDAIVIGLPRGGVVTAYEVAQFLELPLDIICPRKVGAPYNPELALGAVAHTGDKHLNDDIIEQLQVPANFLQKAIEQAKKESATRDAFYRKGRPPLNVKGKTVIFVDDGLATGATMKAAIAWAKAEKAAQIIVAVPVAPASTLEEIQRMCDAVICLSAPYTFHAVGQFYDDFAQTTDDEVLERLQ
ncbi:MAG TPA: phosphoribosyltransferase [Chlamydiales bacterium]|nr:phosphoribosyltransferase [Chlamydiales bacterium]